MPRGGKREAAGGKSTWKHGKTKTIRVPIALADRVIEFAREIDEVGIIEVDTGSKTLDLSGVSIRQTSGVASVYLEDLVKAGYQLKPQTLVNMVLSRLKMIDLQRERGIGSNKG